MKIRTDPEVHLTYCMNVHQGETWPEVMSAMNEFTLPIRKQVCPSEPFGLGLRLSAAAADELSRPENLAGFRHFLEDKDIYIFTINGFPYGRFHGTAVKEQVYQPDWASTERVEYTNLLGNILAVLLPEGVRGSISTLPVTYGPWADDDIVFRARANLTASIEHLARLQDKSGRHIPLGLEPEPDCYLETMPFTVQFIKENFEGEASAHLGVCLDTSHQSTQFEDLAEDVDLLKKEGVPLAKVHLSSALSFTPIGKNLARLKAFTDEVYLHQVRSQARDGGKGPSFGDLPEALEQPPPDGECRVHFHVPLFMTRCRGVNTTSSLLTGRFAELLRGGACDHVEIETYTWSVLPGETEEPDVVEGICSEFEWAVSNIFGK